MTSDRVATAMALLAALALVALWVLLGVVGPAVPGSAGTAPPDAALPPILLGVAIFSALALAGGMAALRDAPLVVVLCGGISLMPVGLYTLLMPFPFRLIGVLDVVLVVAGVMLLRSGPGEELGEASRLPRTRHR